MLHYRHSGSNEQKSIVLLHAAGFDGRIWTRSAELLSGFNCICPDLPGHGKSEVVPFTDFDDASDRVAELIESLDPKPVHLAGLSLGSYVGFRLLVRHPHLVESAIFSGFQHNPIPASVFIRAIMHASTWMMNSKRNREKMARSMGVSDTKLISQASGRSNASSRTMRKIGSLALDFDASPELSHVATRTLVVAGEKEHPAILASLSAFQAAMPNCTSRLAPGLGHGWIANDNELFAETLRAWTEQHPLPDRLAEITQG
ncbi:MAG: alpha/beta hydrolase [Rhodobacteraceae bacterium]|nr:alpha/beta hydrolase [Paracoccaceae bacterium]